MMGQGGHDLNCHVSPIMLAPMMPFLSPSVSPALTLSCHPEPIPPGPAARQEKGYHPRGRVHARILRGGHLPGGGGSGHRGEASRRLRRRFGVLIRRLLSGLGDSGSLLFVRGLARGQGGGGGRVGSGRRRRVPGAVDGGRTHGQSYLQPPTSNHQLPTANHEPLAVSGQPSTI